MEERLDEYERRAQAAFSLLEASMTAGGVLDVHIQLKRSKWGEPYALVKSGGTSHRVEMCIGGNGLRLTRVMKNILEVI